MQLNPDDFSGFIRVLVRLCQAMGIKSSAGRLMALVEFLLLTFLSIILCAVMLHHLFIALLALASGTPISLAEDDTLWIAVGIIAFSGLIVLVRELADLWLRRR